MAAGFSGLILVSACAVAAQDQRSEVLDTANALLASWRDANQAESQRVLHPDFRLTTLQGEPGDRKLYVVDRAGLLKASAGLKPGEWDDRLSDIDVRIGGNGLAIVTARYLFRVNRKPSHCGTVAMQLYREKDSWKIISFADTHNNLNGRPESEVCPAS